LTSSSKYDYLFLGMGCSSLSLLLRMLRSGKFSGKRILLIDKEKKSKNDRTWCFWEQENGFFDEIVYKRWPRISFLSEAFSAEFNITPYEYKMIRGVDFYEYCFREIARHENVELLYAGIGDWQREGDQVTILLDGNSYNLEVGEVFNSIYHPDERKKNLTRLLQHFKGWVIESEEPVFDPAKAIMMDFRVHQEQGTTFAYVLPFSPNKALVEYTLFTKRLLPLGDYDKELKTYINDLIGLKNYKVIEEEFGVIPMTNERFHFLGKAWNLGTAGGQTKGSSGYTFQFIQKNSEQILNLLLANGDLKDLKSTPPRFRFYDNVLLHILYHGQLSGKSIFTTLFQKNKTQQVLKFLDNETSLSEELKIISSLPTFPFLKAALRQF
jgi:lycopene beta-cyclase